MDGLSNKEIIIYSIVGVILLGIIAFAIWYFTIFPASNGETLTGKAQIEGSFNTDSNPVLEDSVDAFMEKEKDMHCAHIYYGSDDKYAYVWMLCNMYEYGDAEVLKLSQSYSNPTKFEYDSDTLAIKTYSFPDAEQNILLNQVFPAEVYSLVDSTKAEDGTLEAEVEAKYRATLVTDEVGTTTSSKDE